MSNIKTFRERAGLTQFQLAEMLGVKRSTVAMWEAGTNMPKANKLLALAKILDCSIEELLEG